MRRVWRLGGDGTRSEGMVPVASSKFPPWLGRLARSHSLRSSFQKTKNKKRPATRKTRLDQTEVPIHSVTPPRKLFLSPSPHPISVAPLEQPEGAFVFCCIRARDKAHLPASRRVK